MIDANPVYLYNHDRLFPVGASFMDPAHKVNPLSVRCHNVKPTGRNIVGTTSWIFQIVGDDVTWYTTPYDWSLIIDSPASIELVLACTKLHAEGEVLRRKIKTARAKIQTISTQDESLT